VNESKSTRNYKKNPASYKKKLEYDKRRNKKTKQKKYRASLNKANRKAGTYGNGDGLDLSHTPSGRLVKKKAAANRGSKTDRPGDRRARGKKK
jgi:hypothetical protein